MNKDGIALAADSAMTIGNRLAIHNSGQKLIQLTPTVAVVWYNAAAFMTVPIELILNLYAKSLQGQTPFARLEDYVETFYRFLEKNDDMFHFSSHEDEFIRDFIEEDLTTLDHNYRGSIEDKQGKLSRKLDEQECRAIAKAAIDELEEAFKDSDKIKTRDFRQYLESSWRYEDYSLLRDILEDREELRWITEEELKRIAAIEYDMLDKDINSRDYTGICFAGYGEKELYPRMTHIHINGWINRKLRYRIVSDEKITGNSTRSSAHIETLAQSNVMDTFFFGIDDDMSDKISEFIRDAASGAIQGISKKELSTQKRELVENALKDLPDKVYKNMINFMGDQYVKEVLASTSHLAITELAELAESMIKLTSLRRSFIVDRNNGTVGGPVDVAVITKCDGFQWVKKKEIGL